MSHAKVFVVSAAVASVLGFAPALLVSGWGSAWGHATGHESRSAAHCQRLPTPERHACVQCVTRTLKHHYHPDYPPGARCRPDNGKP